MAGQGRKAIPTVRATASRGRLTRNTSYDPDRADFLSYLGHPSETNQRPALYNRPSMDHIDNSQLGLLISDRFTSQTKHDYQPPIRPDHFGSLPNIINKPRDSVFHQLMSHQKRVPTEYKTEYQRMFVPHHFSPTVSQNYVPVDPRRESGYTRGTNLQPNYTFKEEKSCTEPTGHLLNTSNNQDFPNTYVRIISVSGYSLRDTDRFILGARPSHT